MADMSEQIEYWQKGSIEDWEVGKQLVEGGKAKHGLFFVHLAVEKVLKAHYCKNKKKQPPKIHNLLRIAELAGLDLDVANKDVLATINRFCLEGRYPESFVKPPSLSDAIRYLEMAEGVIKCLTGQL